MNTPKYIELGELELLIEEQLQSLNADELMWWKNHKIKPEIHSVKNHAESHYVIAKFNDRIILFADDEDEFCIGTLDSSGEIVDYGLCDDLVIAIRLLTKI